VTLVGVIALGEENVITPALRDNLPPQTEALLADARGRVPRLSFSGQAKKSSPKAPSS
jgi:hypothetical protein